MILLDAPIRVREPAASRRTAAVARDRACWVQFCKIVMTPNDGGARRLAGFGVQWPAKRQPPRRMRMWRNLIMTTVT